MAVVITSLTRVGGPGCNHWEITATIDGNPNQRTRIINSDEVLRYGDDLEDGPRKAFILMALRRHYEMGGTPNQLIGRDLESNLGP